MKSIIVVCACVFMTFGVPVEQREGRTLPAVEHVVDRDELGQYTLKYVTVEGTIVIETGKLVDTADGKDKVLIYEGEYTFVIDGQTYTTKYRSDSNGAYEVVGDHLPKPVDPEPVPELPEEMMQPSA